MRECDTGCGAEMCSLQQHIAFIITAHSEPLFCITDTTLWKKKNKLKKWTENHSQVDTLQKGEQRAGDGESFTNIPTSLCCYIHIGFSLHPEELTKPKAHAASSHRSSPHKLSDQGVIRWAASLHCLLCWNHLLQQQQHTNQSAELSLGLHTLVRQLQLNGWNTDLWDPFSNPACIPVTGSGTGLGSISFKEPFF